MTNIIEAIQAESRRLRDNVIPEYEKIAVGAFAVALMKEAILKGEQAIASGDVVECVTALKELRRFEL